MQIRAVDPNVDHNGSQEPAHTEDPIETPDTRSSENKGKKAARTKKRTSRHKNDKTVKFKLPETPKKAARINGSTSDNEVQHVMKIFYSPVKC